MENEACVEERKLIRVPRCAVELRVESRWFEEERGCQVERVEVPDARTVIVVARLVSAAELQVEVRLSAEVREEHLVLVGRSWPSD